MLIYTAGPYGNKTAVNGTGDGFVAGVNGNIDKAREVAAWLWEQGHAVICPHSNTAYFEKLCKATHEDYLRGDLNMIARCDAILMLPGWENSKGSNIERDYALSLNIPVYYWPDQKEELSKLHRAEITSPEQCQAFREILGQMYRTHLDKNADYSPANIKATGEVGLVTRLWDKTARLMSLTGIKFQHLLHEGVEPPRNPKNEAIDDTYMDLSVYAIIGLILRRGKWGR